MVFVDNMLTPWFVRFFTKYQFDPGGEREKDEGRKNNTIGSRTQRRWMNEKDLRTLKKIEIISSGKEML